ncbi:hypothetical protein LEP1GSC158_2448 [Leptospira interrogans serovar Zanoni str. LT2156]|uniref:Uncharacterized protein n=1 Tax=Leptospira interrogans serovar Zanoni str. LT2156 TaxID=1001601 RepID=M6HFT5_LEPIR|nr:hypothetical protein LEP1GSC158_2448 [Leptospira interrogans serovar Zanoni str. LT2156]
MVVPTLKGSVCKVQIPTFFRIIIPYVELTLESSIFWILI